MSDIPEPKTYWERRCWINEQVIDNLITIIGSSLPHTRSELTTLCDGWQNAIEGIVVEGEVK